MSSTLKLGTRRSLLAWAQSSWVARQIERLNPGTKVELVGIDTRGDKILDVSLRNVVGKEFFVAELDDALRAGHVDFSVHSMKDLSLERPEGFVLAAIPKRENPRDVILFGPRAIENLRAGRALKIGTSSPRRLENIPPFLEQALPRFGVGSPSVELVEIRGNVNTRLGRVHEPATSERALDGVVLAFAGLIRLWADDKGREELAKLLQGVRWMVLPLRECAAAPAQGALAVECRADDARTRAALAKLHDADTDRRVRRERQLLADWGGGCHQRFGATAVATPELGEILFIRGRKSPEHASEAVDEIRWDAPAAPTKDLSAAWDGSRARGNAIEELPLADAREPAIFVAHARALRDPLRIAPAARVWTSGTASWFKLAQQGTWVEGCAEGLGFEFVKPTLGEGVLQLPAWGAQWAVFTHDRALEGWSGARAVATYRVPDSSRAEPSDRGAQSQADAIGALSTAYQVYWSSGSQWDELGKHARAGARHACGPGKTAAYLKSRGIVPTVFPSAEEWRAWLRSNVKN